MARRAALQREGRGVRALIYHPSCMYHPGRRADGGLRYHPHQFVSVPSNAHRTASFCHLRARAAAAALGEGGGTMATARDGGEGAPPQETKIRDSSSEWSCSIA